MKEELYITATCNITNGVVWKSGAPRVVSDDNGNEFFISAYQRFKFNYPKFYKMDNLSKLGWLTAEILLRDSFTKEDYRPEDVGIILANANSSLDDDLKYFDTVNDVASPSLFVYTLPNIVMGEISIRHGFNGEQAFFIQETFDTEFIYQQVSYLLENNILQACICGWVDVVGQNYRSALFLVEKIKKENAALFSTAQMETIFNNTAKA